MTVDFFFLMGIEDISISYTLILNKCVSFFLENKMYKTATLMSNSMITQ